ncbi:hypothetical protein S83_071088 [Arachis hypogaea]
MTTSPLLLLFIIIILFLISFRRCPPLKAHPPPRLSLLPMGFMLRWQVESQHPRYHQEAVVVKEKGQLRWQRRREGRWRNQWTRPAFRSRDA